MINRDPWNPTDEQIAKAIRCPLRSVKRNWPLIDNELALYGMKDAASAIVTLATVAVETAHTFEPIHEYGNAHYFTEHYWEDLKNRRSLGNKSPEDAVKFAGRGFIQLTGRHNYESFEADTGFPVVKKPDLLLQAPISAKSCARFIHTHGVNIWAIRAVRATAPQESEKAWQMCRRLVNGGLNGYPFFKQHVDALISLL